MNDDFNFKNTAFWGAITGGISLYRYLAAKRKKTESEINLAQKIEEKTMSDKKDIKNVMEVLDFGFEAMKVGKDLFAGGLHIDKIGELFPLYPKALAAYENIGEVLPEMADLDAEESAALIAFIVGKGIADAHAVAVIEKSLKVGVAALELIKELKN